MLKIDNKIILGPIPCDIPLCIPISENEIPISPGDFWRMNQNKMFISVTESKEDSIKLIGKYKDGNTYVSEKIDEDMTEEEEEIYCKKLHISRTKLANEAKWDETELCIASNDGVKNE